jgi:outer membrane protein OmpA-like peptidoglycan-associated protein
MGVVTREITPDVIDRAARTTGENRDRTKSALSASVPSVLTALSDVATSNEGAAHLKHVIDESQRRGGTAATPFGSAASAGAGAALFDEEAGDRSSSISSAIARSSGVKPESAHQLLGGVTSLALMAIGKNASGIGPESLKAMFREQRGDWLRRLPGPIASLFGTAAAPRAAVATGTQQVVERERVGGPAIRELRTTHRRGWLGPLLLLAALILVAIPLIRGLRRPTAPLPSKPVAMQPLPPAENISIALPNGQSVTVTRGSATYGLATFLAGSGATPQRFTLSPFNYDFASTKLTPESMKTVDELAAILNAYPTASIRVESHTDNVGTPESNLQLSQSRSEAVKGLLASRDVAASRIETAGLGQENPIATNDTTEGRAQNRRTDIVVTGR